jgi:hypothetical protein
VPQTPGYGVDEEFPGSILKKPQTQRHQPE